MNGSDCGPIAAYRREWLPELLVLAGLALAATLAFAATDWDIAAQRVFYHPELSDPWADARRPFWRLLYRSAPWVTGSLAAAGAAMLVAGLVRGNRRRLRLHGIFLLLCVVVGPGLIVNGILKDHWGRPRPRQIVAFGGSLPYVAPLVPSGAHGKSFPCGHCSVGYLYGAGWWLWRKRRPRMAAASLAVGVTVGTLLGVARMAAGGHFLSDAVWSALIAYGAAHALHYYVLRIPARDDSRDAVYPLFARSRRARNAAMAFAVLLGLGIVGGGILADPCDADLAGRMKISELPGKPEALEVVAGTLDVEITLVAGPPDEISSTGSVHGFGLPTNKIRAGWEFFAKPVPTLTYRVAQTGFFTDLDGRARFRLPAGAFRTIAVRVDRGDIAVVAADGARHPGRGLPALDLRTGSGRVRRP